MPASNQDIEWAVEDIKARAETIGLYRRYYDGLHRMPWATPKWNVAFRELFLRFRDNLCARVIDSKADRLQLEGITAGDGDGDQALNAAIETVWQREMLETRQGEIHKSALKDGDAYIIVWPNEQNVARWFIQRGDRMAVKYKDEPQGEIERAAKLWPVKEYTKTDQKCNWRLNIYYEDRIERFITGQEHVSTDVPEKPEKWEEFVPAQSEDYEDDDEGAPQPGYVVPNDFQRVPVFPFPNNADTNSYGRSELKDVIPIQDALNKSVANMLVAGEFVSWPQRYLIGVEVDVDEEGNPTGNEQKAAFDRILAIGNPNAKAGTFEGANLTGFIAEQDSYRAEMARISGTPLHYLLLSGDFPSGAAVTAVERPLMAQIDDRIKALRPAWSAAMSFSLRVENVDHDPIKLNPTFADTTYIDPATQAEDWRVKKEMGVPDEQIWREMGYDKAQIEEFTAAKEERTIAMQAAFNSGTPDSINPEAEPSGGPFGGAAGASTATAS